VADRIYLSNTWWCVDWPKKLILLSISRHTVVCYVAQESRTCMHKPSILTWRTKYGFTAIRSSVISSPNKTQFIGQVLAYQGKLPTRFQVNHASDSWDMNTLAKTPIKYIHVIWLSGRHWKWYEAHFGTKFVLNTSKIGRVMNHFSWNMMPICCHTYRINHL